MHSWILRRTHTPAFKPHTTLCGPESDTHLKLSTSKKRNRKRGLASEPKVDSRDVKEGLGIGTENRKQEIENWKPEIG